MEKTIKTEKLPIYSWTREIEEGALEQAKNLANLPVAFHHIAIMSDVHEGYGMPIGGIMATKGAVVPNAVGVDIGCGMRTTQTSLKLEEIKPKIKDLLHEVIRSIPTGFYHHKVKQDSELFKNPPESPIIAQELEAAKYQLGTLGGGNHFIEVLKDKDDQIWFMVHSGSRNFGYKTAEYYHKKALAIHSEHKDLAWLETDKKIGREYFDAMNYAVEFARLNRTHILDKVIEVVTRILGNFENKLPLDIHHNFASFEEHFGEQVYVHRKGATRAFKDEEGIIPGSMGTPSYIVRGLGNEKSFKSCSHGAGRCMSRKKAKKTFEFNQLKKELEDKKITLEAAHKSQALEEAPGAYKDIDEVIKKQEDLVEVIYRLEPMGVVVA